MHCASAVLQRQRANPALARAAYPTVPFRTPHPLCAGGKVTVAYLVKNAQGVKCGDCGSRLQGVSLAAASVEEEEGGFVFMPGEWCPRGRWHAAGALRWMRLASYHAAALAAGAASGCVLRSRRLAMSRPSAYMRHSSGGGRVWPASTSFGGGVGCGYPPTCQRRIDQLPDCLGASPHLLPRTRRGLDFSCAIPAPHLTDNAGPSASCTPTRTPAHVPHHNRLVCTPPRALRRSPRSAPPRSAASPRASAPCRARTAAAAAPSARAAASCAPSSSRSRRS